MKQRIAIIAVVIAAFVAAAWSWRRASRSRDPGDSADLLRAAHEFRENLALWSNLTWGEHNIGIDSLRGPDDALVLTLRGADGSCTRPAVHLFILYMFGAITPVQTITCHDARATITVDVASYRRKIRAMFPMLPDRPDTQVEFGGAVSAMPESRGRYENTAFATRQALIDYLQIEPRGYQFGTPSPMHAKGFGLYAAEHDDRILVIETAACDHMTWRGVMFSSTGGSRATVFKWTELGGTFLVCKGERHLGLLGMRDALESIELYPVNSVAECADRDTMDRCN